jgi:hypothetical protein
VLVGFFPDPVPPNFIPLGNLFSPFSKFRGVVPWKNIQRRWGYNQKKVGNKTHYFPDFGPGILI